MERKITTLLLLVGMLSLVISIAGAQDFTYTCDEPTQLGQSGGENIFEMHLTNLSSSAADFDVTMDVDGLGVWSYFWCVGLICLPPGTASYTVQVQPSQTDTVFLHVFPDSSVQDEGTAITSAYPSGNPGAAQSHTLTIYFGNGVKDRILTELPADFEIGTVYPNPFNPSTAITYSLAQPQRMNITVFNAFGQAVRHLVDGQRQPGVHLVTWDGRDENGLDLPSAAYFVVLQGENLQKTVSLLKLK